QFTLHLIQHFGHTKQSCSVSVMATGMHGTFIDRPELKTGLLLNRKCVEIRPKCNSRSVQVTFQVSNDTVAADTGLHFMTQLLMKVSNVFRCFNLFDSSGYLCKRSEEHTSELQSRFDLVCRLLLEK